MRGSRALTLRSAAIGVALGAALAVVACAERGERPDPEAARLADDGARLYDGRAALRGRIHGHETLLMPAAVVCANCHAPARNVTTAVLPAAAAGDQASIAAKAGTGAQGVTADQASIAGQPAQTTETLGPQLDRERLTASISRRGGPPSRFDRATFCRMLRTGEDPASVLLPKVMPRYELTDEQCAALWHHLTRKAGLNPGLRG